jgi:hypothetical protein
MTLAAIAIVSSGCVAHHGGWRHDRQQDRHRDAYRVGYDRGYDEGFRHGRIDGHRRDSYGFRHAPGYRHADRGYRGPYGSRDRYVDGYRRGYERGYRKAFDAERRAHRSRGHHCRSGRRGVERDRYGVRRPGPER